MEFECTVHRNQCGLGIEVSDDNRILSIHPDGGAAASGAGLQARTPPSAPGPSRRTADTPHAPLYLPYISPTSRLHLPYLSQAGDLVIGIDGQPLRAAMKHVVNPLVPAYVLTARRSSSA